ncbi:MAG: glycoside hydrolase family 20 zincin-like fold domain-containing protein, partial [Victivallales bacterium]
MSDVNEKICRLEESRIFFNRNRIEEFSQNKKRRLEVYKILKYVGLIIMNCFIYNISFGDVTGLNAQNEKEWISYTLPLPHEISIKKKVTIPVKNLSIKTAKDAGAVVNNAARLLKMFYMAKTGTEAKGDGFEIIIGKIDKNGYVDTLQVPNWQRLTKLKNNDQAYFIIPVQDNKLLVTGLNEKGIFYGVQTLKQLLNKDINETQVVIPLATITDWPDLSCRGLWNGESLLLYEYLSMVKLNYAKNYVASSPFIRKGKISIL